MCRGFFFYTWFHFYFLSQTTKNDLNLFYYLTNPVICSSSLLPPYGYSFYSSRFGLDSILYYYHYHWLRYTQSRILLRTEQRTNALLLPFVADVGWLDYVNLFTSDRIECVIEWTYQFVWLVGKNIAPTRFRISRRVRLPWKTRYDERIFIVTVLVTFIVIDVIIIKRWYQKQWYTVYSDQRYHITRTAKFTTGTASIHFSFLVRSSSLDGVIYNKHINATVVLLFPSSADEYFSVLFGSHILCPVLFSN